MCWQHCSFAFKLPLAVVIIIPCFFDLINNFLLFGGQLCRTFGPIVFIMVIAIMGMKIHAIVIVVQIDLLRSLSMVVIIGNGFNLFCELTDT